MSSRGEPIYIPAYQIMHDVTMNIGLSIMLDSRQFLEAMNIAPQQARPSFILKHKPMHITSPVAIYFSVVIR